MPAPVLEQPQAAAAEEQEDAVTGERYLLVRARGAALQYDPILNKGTCFTLEERRALGLEGLLPPAVATPEEQAARAYGNYCKAGDDVQRYIFLSALQDRNETLFYRLLLEHLEEMAPIVYTPTVGKVCEQYSHLYRRPRGVYLSLQDRGRLADVLRNAPRRDYRVIVATDNEAILGIGDQGAGGMGIPIGKLALYTAGAGIHPGWGLPLDLDVGTDNEARLADPLYIGLRQPRLRGSEYYAFLDEVVDAIQKAFPRALVQWEDFAKENAVTVLERYRRRLPTFNDDIQGTGAVVVAGVRSAVRQVGRELRDERIVMYGAGAAGGGCVQALRRCLAGAGVAEEARRRAVLCLDSRGLLLRDRPGLKGYKADLAADPSLVAGWKAARPGIFQLPDVIRNFRPTILIGTSGQPRAFTEEIVREMHRHCPRPIVMPLSNPNSLAEADPADVLRWTRGAAVVGTGSPFPPATVDGVTYAIGQGNNALIFPGVGLGAVAVGARWLPDAAFQAASEALFEFSPAGSRPGTPIYPALSNLREVCRRVAVAVARALVAEGAAPPLRPEECEARVARTIWSPTYLPYRAA